MGYIGYSEGFNSGGATGFLDPSDGVFKISPYKPQTLKNTEIGIRSDLANKHLRLNATLFNTIWDDVQALGPVLDESPREHARHDSTLRTASRLVIGTSPRTASIVLYLPASAHAVLVSLRGTRGGVKAL